MKKHTYIVTFKRKWIIFAIEDVKQSNKCNCILSTLYMYIISSVKNVIVKKAQLTKICPANYFLHERLKLRLVYVVCKHIFIRCFLVCLSVCHNFLKGREVLLSCSCRSTFFLLMTFLGRVVSSSSAPTALPQLPTWTGNQDWTRTWSYA